MKRPAWLGLIAAVVPAGACTFDGLDAYDQPDATADATAGDGSADGGEAGPPDASPDVVADVAAKDACAGCRPIVCGDAGTCTSPAQVCCAKSTPGSFDGSFSYQIGQFACVDAGSCGATGSVQIACSGPGSCANNEVCCGSGLQLGTCVMTKSTACAAACTAGQYVVGCTSNAECEGGTCGTSTCTLPGYSICK